MTHGPPYGPGCRCWCHVRPVVCTLACCGCIVHPHLSVPPPIVPAMADCSRCGKQAVCVYGIHADETYACREHDPMAQPGWASVVLPEGFRYTTLATFTDAMAAPTLATQIVITNDGGGP